MSIRKCCDPLSPVVLNSAPIRACDEDLAGPLTVESGKGFRFSRAIGQNRGGACLGREEFIPRAVPEPIFFD